VVSILDLVASTTPRLELNCFVMPLLQEFLESHVPIISKEALYGYLKSPVAYPFLILDPKVNFQNGNGPASYL
jgi:hypothetical protein